MIRSIAFHVRSSDYDGPSVIRNFAPETTWDDPLFQEEVGRFIFLYRCKQVRSMVDFVIDVEIYHARHSGNNVNADRLQMVDADLNWKYETGTILAAALDQDYTIKLDLVLQELCSTLRDFAQSGDPSVLYAFRQRYASEIPLENR